MLSPGAITRRNRKNREGESIETEGLMETRREWEGRGHRSLGVVFSSGVNQIEIQYLVITCCPMFYFVYPNYLLPNSQNWILPSTELVHPAPTAEEEQNSNFCKQTIAETILLTPCREDLRQGLLSVGSSRDVKLGSKPKSVSKDQDYRPETYLCKRSKKSQQLENRNVVPNIIRLILSFIQKKGKSLRIVERIFARSKTGQGWSPKRFYLYQAMIRGKMDNYVNEDTLRQLVRTRPEEEALYPAYEQRFYSSITRTLIAYFLREEIAACVLTSKRMDRAKKSLHLAALRNIREALPTLLRA